MAHVAIAGRIGGQHPSLVTLSTPAADVLVGNFAATDRAGALRAAFDTLTQDDLTGCRCLWDATEHRCGSVE